MNKIIKNKIFLISFIFIILVYIVKTNNKKYLQTEIRILFLI